MQFAVTAGEIRVVEQMLQLGVPMDDMNEFGMRPIAYAAGLADHQASLGLVSYFLDHGVVADVFSSHR